MKKIGWLLIFVFMNISLASAMTREEEDAVFRALMAQQGQEVVETLQQKVVAAVPVVTATLPAGDVAGESGKKESPLKPQPQEEGSTMVAQATNVDSAVQAVADGAAKVPTVGEKKKPDNFYKVRHFYEASAYVGAYRFDTGSHGTWLMVEGIKWLRGDKDEDPQNFGFGFTVKGDQGETGDGRYDWSSIAVGPNLDYWAELGMGQDYFLAKFRPLYRWKQDGSSGFMPGAYLELDHLMGQNDAIIAALDGQYFPGDSYASLSLLWDHRFNKDFKVKGGFSLTGNFGEDSIFGIGPTVSVRLYDHWILGASLNFLENGGSVFGVYGGYELNTDLRQWDAESREESVILVTDDSQSKKTTGNENPKGEDEL